MVKLNNRTLDDVDLPALADELRAAGIPVGALGTRGDEVHTYDEQGEPDSLPDAAQAIVDAHIPPERPHPRAELLRRLDGARTVADLKAILRELVEQG